jgi:thioredoxin-like negative regulator of GroEL
MEPEKSVNVGLARMAMLPMSLLMETTMGKATNEPETQMLDELALRMTAYRERAAVARRLADAITDKRATTGLLAHAQEFDKKAEAIATRIVLLAHLKEHRTDGDLDRRARVTPTRKKDR